MTKVSMTDVFRQQGRSEEFIECVAHLENIKDLVSSLSDDEANLVRMYVSNAYNSKVKEQKGNVLSQDEMDALLSHEEPD